jgi:hypothetical protein
MIIISVEPELAGTVDLYNIREAEILKYIDFVVTMIDKKVSHFAAEQNIDKKPKYNIIYDYNIPSEIRKTLLSSAYLLMYNMVEATMKNAVDALRKILNEREDVFFNDLNDILKKYILNDFKKHYNNNDTDILCNPICKKILNDKYCDIKELFNGNIDDKAIREILCKNFGLNDYMKGRHKEERGESLRTIKNNRNNLAHGNISFNELGGDLSIDTVKTDFNTATKHLEIVLTNINSFITDEKFRA